DEMHPYLVIKVNGKRIFCKGGNWGMDDGMKRVRKELLEPYFKLHKEANFNMIRNWTGESTEELFYDLADEYGMLVWNDFWLSTEGYNLEPTDNKLFIENVTDVVKRFRNHASLAIWCPRNEGYAPVAIENDIAKIIAEEDGTRHYQGNSRYLNLRPSGPWHYYKAPAEYFRNIAKGFNTELGTPSIPTAESMRKMMPKEDVWPISDSWFYHDLHNGQKEFRAAIDSLYGKPQTLDEFCTKAQMLNYESHRAMFESWNSKLWNNTSGILLWMTHPAWPSTVWQVYSWDYETFGSYFASKKACEPIHVQMNLDDNKVSVVNTSFDSIEDAKVRMEFFDISGRSLFIDEMKEYITPNRPTYFFTARFPANLPPIFLARLI
ncbi:MAG: glycoside hydrolase family 2 TIM barrel-domain containing protein, partial [Ignavibacteria bacterium]|nr:glycoside hydrolase family 2 TIM barrel-domain containing protein [Ignavibacteria bacterium]